MPTSVYPRPSQELPASPFPGDVIVVEVANSNLFPGLPEFGAPHPNGNKYPNHKFGWAGDPQTNGTQNLYYVADRAFQHLYNWEVEPYAEWPKVVQIFVIPRDSFDPTSLDYAPPPPERIDCSEYKITEIQQHRVDDTRLDSLFVKVVVIREKINQPLIGIEFDSDTGVLITTEKQKVPAGTPGSGISDTGSFSEIQPINSAWSIRTTRKAAGIVGQAIGGTATRSYPIVVNYSWPAVLYDVDVRFPELKKGGFGPSIVIPNWIRSAYSGPCVAMVVETWTKDVPIATPGITMTPGDIEWDGLLFKFHASNCLHGGMSFYESPGTEHPTYEYYRSERYYPPTFPADWPYYITSQITTSPYWGGWLRREIRVYNPHAYALAASVMVGLVNIEPHSSEAQWVTAVAGTASVYVRTAGSGSWGSAVATGVTGPTYTVSGLNPATNYELKVVIGGTTSNIVAFTTPHAGPAITNSTLTASAIQGVAFSGYTVTATGGDIVYSVDNVLPGLAIDSSTGSITGTPTSTSGGSWTIVLGATNSAGSDSKNLVVDYTAIPILDSALTDTALEGAAFSYSITALNTPTSYAATFLPSGLYVNTGTGAVTGTPTGTSSTTWNIGIGATNAAGTDTDTLVVTYTAKPTVAASQTFSHTNSSTGLSNFVSATNTPTSWAVTSDPNGFFTDHPFMVFSTSTGEIYGDLSATTNTYHLSITATNAAGTRAPVTVTYTVT